MGLELKYKDRNGDGLTDMGREIHPQGLERTLQEASKPRLPMIITENGIASQDGQRRIRFIKSHIDILEKCLHKGMDIRGYFYWSLLDNYVWPRGLDPRFSLYTVNYDTLERKPTHLARFIPTSFKKSPVFNRDLCHCFGLSQKNHLFVTSLKSKNSNHLLEDWHLSGECERPLVIHRSKNMVPLISSVLSILCASLVLCTDSHGKEAVCLESWLLQAENLLYQAESYTALFHKQERIKGFLKAKETVYLRFKKPFKVHMTWVDGPGKGREIF